MSTFQLARAWRDPVYRASLDEEALQRLQAHPSGQSVEPLFSNTGDGDKTDFITGTDGCTTPGCTQIVCTDPCGSLGCNKTDKPNCTLGGDCKMEA